MANEPRPVSSHRAVRLAEKLREKDYRDNYVSARTRQFLAHQIRSLRGEMSQGDFGILLDKPQSVISRLESPAYGKWTLQTLLDVASKLDVGLLVQFVDYPTFLNFTGDVSESAVRPAKYDAEVLDRAALETAILPTQQFTIGSMEWGNVHEFMAVDENTFFGVALNNMALVDKTFGQTSTLLTRQTSILKTQSYQDNLQLEINDPDDDIDEQLVEPSVAAAGLSKMGVYRG
jgi:hypothetical protein